MHIELNVHLCLVLWLQFLEINYPGYLMHVFKPGDVSQIVAIALKGWVSKLLNSID